ncbi:Growth-regulating factor 1 [Apostasia shenzhenica]|uniref:Growth-regulating factor n=1 Tax=Apostasia shenzhenica TaxID=1088818 RepID=A0A2I0A367_9ASPA|nr:Growth-regulating factor 1 [Apostasia shenzhenica]
MRTIATVDARLRALEPSKRSSKPATKKTADVLQKEEAGAPVVDLEVEAPPAKVARVLVRTLESAQETATEEVTEVVNVFDSPVKLPLKTGERKELIVVGETPARKRLEPGKILLKDEDIERLFPKFGAPVEGSVKKTPLVICGPAPLGESVLLPIKTKKPLFPRLLLTGLQNEEKDKEESSKMEEEIKEKKEAPQVAPEAALGIEGTWGVLEKSLLEIRGEEGKILKGISQVLKVVKNLMGKEGGEARFFRRIVEVESALLQVTKYSQARGSLICVSGKGVLYEERRGRATPITTGAAEESSSSMIIDPGQTSGTRDRPTIVHDDPGIDLHNLGPDDTKYRLSQSASPNSADLRTDALPHKSTSIKEYHLPLSVKSQQIEKERSPALFLQHGSQALPAASLCLLLLTHNNGGSSLLSQIRMMMMVMSERSYSRNPFTPSQWQELELQALIYKYMASGIPIPLPLRRSFSSYLTFPPQTLVGWSCYQMGYGRKAEDPEPGRCRRTDGKKWRCSKEAYPDSKYCERHMHRGKKNRSRKPVELSLAANSHTFSSSSSSSSSSPYSGRLSVSRPGFSDAPGAERESSLQLKPLGMSSMAEANVEVDNRERPMHHFFDEWPQKNMKPWMELEEDKICYTKTQLSISFPNWFSPFYLQNPFIC